MQNANPLLLFLVIFAAVLAALTVAGLVAKQQVTESLDNAASPAARLLGLVANK